MGGMVGKPRRGGAGIAQRGRVSPFEARAARIPVGPCDLLGRNQHRFRRSADGNAVRREYLVLGEFWKEADGDLLLIKPDGAPTPIYYYSHGSDKMKKLCGDTGDLMEKKFSYYL
jgi:hypothetical protein